MPWAEREVKLRAYPSSGALYAVEIYPLVFRVEGLDPGVYHYRAVENELEVVRLGLDPPSVARAALPVEREATALGLSARPFGGVFDDLLNDDLGLDTAEEQFLLAVLVGHAHRTS
jgi:hypothetical protein